MAAALLYDVDHVLDARRGTLAVQIVETLGHSQRRDVIAGTARQDL